MAGYRTLASGTVVWVRADGVAEFDSGQDWDEGPTCSICDGLGHGYPGGGACPLEDRGYWDPPDPFDPEDR